MQLDFNSSVVRLKDRLIMAHVWNITEFQFQCGAIKSTFLVLCLTVTYKISIPVWCD